MDSKTVLVFTWFLAASVIGLYIWFVVWRLRVDRRKKQDETAADDAMSDAIARTAAQLRPEPSSPSAAATPVPAAPVTPVRTDTTVAHLVAGIALPHELAPLTTMAPRERVGDRVAFWTDRAPAEVVGPAFASELERLGYTVASLDERTLSALRDDDQLIVTVHPEGKDAYVDGQVAFPSVPEHSVVIEVWVP